MKVKWLDRSIAPPSPHMTLCLTEKEFNLAVKHLGQTPDCKWIKTDQSDATVHIFTGISGIAAIICLRIPEGQPLHEVIGLIVHECVHLWQEWCDYYGERHPASEQEAYAIQHMSQNVVEEYLKRTGK